MWNFWKKKPEAKQARPPVASNFVFSGTQPTTGDPEDVAGPNKFYSVFDDHDRPIGWFMVDETGRWGVRDSNGVMYYNYWHRD